MSALAIKLDRPPKILDAGSQASGAEYQTVRLQLEDVKRHSHTSASAPQSLAYSSLEKIMGDCSRAGWDGFNARPISPATYVNVLTFLDELPMWLPAPEVVPEADGDVAVEWDFGPDRIFSISIGEGGLLHFAGLFGRGVQRHGVELFEGAVSSEILGYINRAVFGPDRTRTRQIA